MWSHPAVLAAIGLVVGFLGSLVGVGGGFFLVPAYMAGLGFLHPKAVGTSLGVVIANAASGTTSYARQHRVDWLVGLILGIATFPGTWLGKEVATRLPQNAFTISFGAYCAVVAFLLVTVRPENRPGLGFFRRGLVRSVTDAKGTRYDYAINLWMAAILSVPVGFLSALFGVGGGVVHVPLLILLFGVPAHVAVATSGFALLLTSAVGTMQYAVAGLVDPRVLLWSGLGAFAGAQLGPRAAERLSPAALRLILAAVLVGVGAWMIYKGVR
jgi:hypothetical protein